VPPALNARTPLELSGGIWVEEKGMALVISDDTGRPGQNEDAPWTFWLSRQGVLAENPVQMVGLKSVSDWESITRAPDGQFYLLSSQSLSAKGKRPKKRQRLIRARLEDQRLVVTGKVNLFNRMKKTHPSTHLESLGFNDALDIEGMTWMDNGLLLGLKAPLDAQQQSRILHLSDLNGLFEEKTGGVLKDFGAVSLPTGTHGEAGGISELLWSESVLYALTTLPDREPAGAAWIIPLPLGTAKPRVLAQWDGLKPEGLVRVSPDQLMVLFDEGGRFPLYTFIAVE